ncbi:MAG: hypothetical protein B6243_04670 [Anaerolineaceae bacterium 4572_5.2]|nr:MAG: hypothetical protein B6243_04670 [Anaerolineaceae bacterium 4572_5.2]
MNIPFILSLIVFLPLLGSIVVMFMPGTKEKEIKNFSIIISLFPFILSILLWTGYDYTQGQYQFVQDYSWIPSLNVRFHMAADGLSIPLIFLTTLLSVLSFWYSSRVIKYRVKEFFALFLMLEMGMLGVFVALDLVLFYFFWEIGLVPMFLLIGIWGQEKDRPQYSAIKFFLYTLVGSVAMLLAFIAIYLQTGTWDVTAIPAMMPFASNPTLAAVAFWAIFIAFAIKVPLFPFHTWLPDAHTAAPTAGSVMPYCLLFCESYGLLYAWFGRRRLLRRPGKPDHRFERGHFADVQSRHYHRRLLLPGRRSLRAHPHPRRFGRIHQRTAGLPRRLRHHARHCHCGYYCHCINRRLYSVENHPVRLSGRVQPGKMEQNLRC